MTDESPDSPKLSQAERDRIYAEERARHDARSAIEGEQRETKQGRSGFSTIVIIIVLLGISGCVYGALTGSGGQSSPSTATAPTPRPTPAARAKTPAENLAILDTGNPNPAEADVAYFDTALDRLASHCIEDKEKIAAMVSRSKDVLAEKGHTRTLRQLFETFIASIPDSPPVNLKCSEVIALSMLFTIEN